MNYYDIKMLCKSYLLEELQFTRFPNLDEQSQASILCLVLGAYLHEKIDHLLEDEIDLLIKSAARMPIYSIVHADRIQKVVRQTVGDISIKDKGLKYAKVCTLAVYLYFAILQEPDVATVIELQS